MLFSRLMVLLRHSSVPKHKCLSIGTAEVGELFAFGRFFDIKNRRELTLNKHLWLKSTRCMACSAEKDQPQNRRWLDATDELEICCRIGTSAAAYPSATLNRKHFCCLLFFCISFDEIILGQCPHVVIFPGAYKGVSHWDHRG